MLSLKDFHSRRSISIVAGLVALGVIAIGLRQFTGSTLSVNSATAKAAPAAVPVSASVATRSNVPDVINAIGTVQSIDSVDVQPRVTGAIVKVEFAPGQDIKKGQELFLIDPRPYQAALDQAKAQLAHDEGVLAEAQMDLTRYQTLQKQQSIATQMAQDQHYVVQQDKGTVQLDQANVETAQLNLDYCHISAPVSGRAGVLQVDLGNLVGPASGQTNSSSSSISTTQASTVSGLNLANDTLVSIAQLQPIYVTFSVPQMALNEIEPNQAKGPLDVEVYSQAGKLLEKGKLSIINNQVTTTTGTVALQATFANPHNVLWPGEYVSVRLIVGMRRNVVIVPAPAVMAGPNGDYVYVIGVGNKVKRVDIQQAVRQGGISVVSKGISAGQKVVTAGQYRLDNGTKVAIQQTTVPQEAARIAADSQPAAAD